MGDSLIQSNTNLLRKGLPIIDDTPGNRGIVFNIHKRTPANDDIVELRQDTATRTFNHQLVGRNYLTRLHILCGIQTFSLGI